MRKVVLILVLLLVVSCNKKSKETKALSFEEQLEQLPDSIKVENIIVYNSFKYQILAHKNGKYDSTAIINKVYKPHRELWDNCYAMIFGEENASKFNTGAGMADWNKTLYPEQKQEFEKRAKVMLSLNLDSLFTVNLKRFNQMVPHNPSAKISIAFVPFYGIGFGGCSANEFVYELNNPEFDIKYTIEKGIPHELNHLAYEPYREADQAAGTSLAQVIDEGFACYFTYVFFNGQITKWEAVENMTKADWNWYLQHEKEIFNKVKGYFTESGMNPLTSYRQDLFPDAPRSLNYWLGYRIIERYVQKHGKDSWKDIYTTPIKQVYQKSGYEEYINSI
jgi:hypothetical protein